MRVEIDLLEGVNPRTRWELSHRSQADVDEGPPVDVALRDLVCLAQGGEARAHAPFVFFGNVTIIRLSERGCGRM